jgi:TatD DNase family protein
MSSYLVHIIDKLAAIYGLSANDIAKTTTENSEAIFGI